MKRLGLFIVIALCAVAGFTLLTQRSQLKMRAELWNPGQGRHTLSGSPIALPLRVPILVNGNAGDSIRISVTGAGSAYIAVVTATVVGRTNLVSWIDGESRVRHCGVDGIKPTACRLAVRVASKQNALVAIYAMNSESRIVDIGSSVATAREISGATGPQLMLGFLVLLLTGPALVWLRRWPNMDRNALILMGLGWMAVAGPAGLIASLVFAAWGYCVIRWLAMRDRRHTGLLVWGILSVATILVFIKFIAPHAAAAFANTGGFWFALPLGISYFAIRMIDLMFTAHSGTLRDMTMRDYLAFLFMPHTLPAGPILTYQEFLRCRIEAYSVVDFGAGAARMMVGFTKKAVADAFLLPLISRAMMSFADGGAGDTPFYVAGMLVLNTLFVYLDFSAYCDLAIGAGRAAGYRIPENFNWPLAQSSLRRFWQHWHMTLTQWVMRRIYFPAFLSARSVTLSMYASMLTIGLWHAPTLSWALWGAHHTAALTVEAKMFPAGRPAAPKPGAIRRMATYASGLLFVWCWVSLGHSFTLFSAPDVAIRCYWTALQIPFDMARHVAMLF